MKRLVCAGMKRLFEVALLAVALLLAPALLQPLAGLRPAEEPWVAAAFAVQPDEVLPDAALERRARAVSAGLRCLVCQNQSIDDSDASLAKDLRVLVRERLLAGDSDAAATDYIVRRYGEFVLLKPRLSLETLALWGTPLALLAAGLLFALLSARRRRGEAPPARLTAEEEEAVERALGETVP